MATTDIQSQIDRYKDQIAELEEKKLINDSAVPALIELWDNRIAEKSNIIQTLEDKLQYLESRPKLLQYKSPVLMMGLLLLPFILLLLYPTSYLCPHLFAFSSC